MISTATAQTSAYASRPSAGPQMAQAMNVQHRRRNDERHEPAGDDVGDALDRRAAPLGGGHHVDDLREHVSRPTFFGTHLKRAGLVHRAADHRVADALLDRHRLAGEHRFVDRARAFGDLAVDGNLLARPDAQDVADLHLVERDFVVHAVADDAGRRRRERQEFADRGAGAAAGTQFQHLAQQHQRRDHRGRLEVDCAPGHDA